MAGLAIPSQAADEPKRVAGADRVETAIKVLESFKGWSDTAILVRKDTFADSLAATPLAGANKSPILLTDSKQLDNRVVDTLRRHGFKTVLAVGGPAALNQTVLDQVKAAGFTSERISGASRYETALTLAQRTAQKLGKADAPIFVATGTDFADALSAGAAAVRNRGVLLLSKGKTLTTQAHEFITSRANAPVVAVGGPAAAATQSAAVNAKVVIGKDRYDTAAQLVEHYYGKPQSALIASGEDFADAMTAGVVAGLTGQPLLPTKKDAVPAPIAKYLEKNKDSLSKVTVVGGEKAVTPTVSQQTQKTIIPQTWAAPQNKGSEVKVGNDSSNWDKACYVHETVGQTCKIDWGYPVLGKTAYVSEGEEDLSYSDLLTLSNGFGIDLGKAPENLTLLIRVVSNFFASGDVTQPPNGKVKMELIPAGGSSTSQVLFERNITEKMLPYEGDWHVTSIPQKVEKSKLEKGSYVVHITYEPSEHDKKLGFIALDNSAPLLIWNSSETTAATIKVKDGDKLVLKQGSGFGADDTGFSANAQGGHYSAQNGAGDQTFAADYPEITVSAGSELVSDDGTIELWVSGNECDYIPQSAGGVTVNYKNGKVDWSTISALGRHQRTPLSPLYELYRSIDYSRGAPNEPLAKVCAAITWSQNYKTTQATVIPIELQNKILNQPYCLKNGGIKYEKKDAITAANRERIVGTCYNIKDPKWLSFDLAYPEAWNNENADKFKVLVDPLTKNGEAVANAYQLSIAQSAATTEHPKMYKGEKPEAGSFGYFVKYRGTSIHRVDVFSTWGEGYAANSQQ